MKDLIDVDAPTKEELTKEVSRMVNLGYIPVGEVRDVEIISCGEGCCDIQHWPCQRMIRDVDHD